VVGAGVIGDILAGRRLLHVFAPNDATKAMKAKYLFLSVVFPCMLIITQLLFQQNALVFIKSTRYYNLYFLSLYS
jgi:hypothetical protein